VNTNKTLAKNLFGELEAVPTRNGYGEGMVIAGEKNKDVVVLCADLTDSTRSAGFAKAFPKRFIECGVAEQNMMSVAAGMALAGKIPFVSTYAVFCPGINWSQIRVNVLQNNANVKITGAHAGISVGPDGLSHQALEDMGIMRVLPGMIVLAPCDAIETRKATIAAAKHKGAVYLRFAREKTPVFTTEKTPFKIGKAEVFAQGKDVTIIACGPLVYEALLAAKKLEKEISVEVINSPSVKPLDEKTILKSVKKTGAVVTVEEHQITGGLGSAIAELLGEKYPVRMKRVGVKDRFGGSGKPDELIKIFGMSASSIVKAVRAVYK